jgi:hypothetical protein
MVFHVSTLSKSFCRSGLTLLLLAGLAACGGGTPRGDTSPLRLQQVSTDGVARFASGPIQTACRAQPRGNASIAKCGCVQAAADLTLSRDEQKQGARFFQNPELLQQMKLSDTPKNERLWYTWERFAQTAETLCRDV